METVLVTMDKSAEEFVSEAKTNLEKDNAVVIKGKSRDTVKAVDVAELLKVQGFKTKNISIETEEKEASEGKTLRTSVITIEMEK